MAQTTRLASFGPVLVVTILPRHTVHRSLVVMAVEVVVALIEVVTVVVVVEVGGCHGRCCYVRLGSKGT